MNKKDCKIVQDLLPNYIDKLTTLETNEFIENHLKECKECTKILENMKKDFDIETKNKDKKVINFIKKYNKKMRILKLIILSIIVIYLAILGRKAVIMIDLINKSSQKARTEYSVSYKIIENNGNIYANLYTKDNEYIVEYDYISTEYKKIHVIEFCNGNTSNYYIENELGEKTAFLNQPKGNIMRLTPKDCCFGIDNNVITFIKNVFKASIKTVKYSDFEEYYCILNYEWSDFGTSEIYVNKDTGVVKRGITGKRTANTPVGEHSIIDIDFSSGYSLNENIVKEKEPNIDEYKIIEE